MLAPLEPRPHGGPAPAIVLEHQFKHGRAAWGRTVRSAGPSPALQCSRGPWPPRGGPRRRPWWRGLPGGSGPRSATPWAGWPATFLAPTCWYRSSGRWCPSAWRRWRPPRRGSPGCGGAPLAPTSVCSAGCAPPAATAAGRYGHPTSGTERRRPSRSTDPASTGPRERQPGTTRPMATTSSTTRRNLPHPWRPIAAPGMRSQIAVHRRPSGAAAIE